MRLMAKTISYGFVHIAVAMTVAFVLTGNWMIAVGVGLLEPLVQMAVYPLHEWLWEGRKAKKVDAQTQILESMSSSSTPLVSGKNFATTTN